MNNAAKFMPLENLLLNHWWFGAALMFVVGISDYALTLYGAKLHRQVRSRIAIEGSYETVPMFESDIDQGRLFSYRLLVALLLMAGFLAALARYRETIPGNDEMYLGAAGFLILIEAPIHLRHISNIVRFSLLKRSDAATGQIVFSRWFVMRMSGADLMAFSVLLFLGFAGIASWFLLGGAIRCLAFGIYQLFLSFNGKARAKCDPGLTVAESKK